MDLEPPKLATFKYKHEGRVTLSMRRKIAFAASLIGALLIAKLTFPFGLFALVVPAIVYFSGGRTLKMGPRYFICGDRLIYYANVRQADLSEAEGRLVLSMRQGAPFVIERGKFPTNARKKDKIAANQAAKFNKVTARIVEKVRRAAPPETAGA